MPQHQTRRQNKLIALRGLPGSGKSFLCQALIHQLNEHFTNNNAQEHPTIVKFSRDELRNTILPLGPTFSSSEKKMIDDWIRNSIGFFMNSDCRYCFFLDGMCLSSLESVQHFASLTCSCDEFSLDFYLIEVTRDETECRRSIEDQRSTHLAKDRDYDKVKQSFEKVLTGSENWNVRCIENDTMIMEKIAGLVEWILQ